jgi:hypothetical protein
MAILEKVQKAQTKIQLKYELNEAIRSLEKNIDKNFREISVETKKKIDKENIRLIHDLFYARTL